MNLWQVLFRSSILPARTRATRSNTPQWLRGYTQSATFRNSTPSRTRNLGIIAHIDAGKTTTTERMLYYGGHTARIGDVDDGSTVTDFLPAERARGITIQSAAITFKWPPQGREQAIESASSNQPLSASSHEINLIDTPGHADFTFEVLRSLRVLDGAICVLDGVAGVEAQTEIVWSQADNYGIPKIVFVNKLDRDGASFARSVQEIASKLHVWPALCQIPYWNMSNKQFCGVGDVIHLHALQWESDTDGKTISKLGLSDLEIENEVFATELKAARVALIELLSEHDDQMVEHFLESDEDHLAIKPSLILNSMRRCVMAKPQAIVPVLAGASFRNIGVQPLLDAVVDLLPAPEERPDPDITISGQKKTLAKTVAPTTSSSKSLSGKKSARYDPSKLQGCALAFKVVNDTKRGVLVYVRVYHGQLIQGSALFNTSLNVGERPGRLLRMYASDAAEIDIIEAGHIGVIVGLKHTRTGDTLVSYAGMNWKTGPPEPIDSLQLRPISVPPPVFFASIEPMSLAEEKPVMSALDILLREDPSLHVMKDVESGQTHISGMGELHLEIACDRLIKDLRAKATVGQIEISYRESITADSTEQLATFEQEVSGKLTRASCLALVRPSSEHQKHTGDPESASYYELPDNNHLTIHHARLDSTGRSTDPGDPPLHNELSYKAVLTSLHSGTTAGLARGPAYGLPVHSVHVHIYLKAKEHIFQETTIGAVAAAARKAVQLAVSDANRTRDPVLLEPVMRANISVNDDSLGPVVRDISSARGGTVLSLGDESSLESPLDASDILGSEAKRLINVKGVYVPPDPFLSAASHSSPGAGAQLRRHITARVPLKEMIGYLKHLRSLTGGRGTFLMQVDRFEPVRGQRLKNTLIDLRGW